MAIEVNTQVRELRRQLSLMARDSRTSIIPKDSPLNLPQSEQEDEILFEGKVIKRKRIVLLTNGCSVATCTMCPLPSEALELGRKISDKDIVSQFDFSFRQSPISGFDMITVYTNGNWFVDSEISPNARSQIYKRVEDSNATILTVESLPQFITEEKVSQAKKDLGEKKLSVAIGLQSSNDTVRQLAINSTCTRTSFEKGTAILREYDYTPQVFLMIKPPFLTETEGIEDALSSISYLSALDINTPVLCPTRIAPNAVLSKLSQAGEYKPLWLWSVIEVLRKNQSLNPNSMPRIATSELKIQANPNSIVVQNCDSCSFEIIEKIDQFNISRDFRELDKINCSCKSDYLQTVATEDAKTFLSIPERVSSFLEQQSKTNNAYLSKALVVFSR